jgi:HKD family nuclease
MNPIRIGTIDNTGPNTLLSYLRNAGHAAAQFDIAVAFISKAGLESVLHLLKRVAAKGPVRLLTGLYQGFTDPAALRILLREEANSQGRLTVKISTNPRFHWKAYFLMRKTTANVVIGSSNLTEEGLTNSGELNSVLLLQKNSQPFRELHAIFNRQWDTRAKPLSGIDLNAYEEWRKVADVQAQHRKVPLRAILGNYSSDSKTEHIRTARRLWRFCFASNLDARSIEIVSRYTDWEQRGYEYFSAAKPIYQDGDRFVLFDLSDRTLTVNEVLASTRTPEPTPAGYHFFAYRRVPRTRLRRLLRKRWAELKAANLLSHKEQIFRDKTISQTEFDRYLAFLKRK